MTGLVGWWRLDGHANDSIGGHNGTIIGSIATTDRFGRADMAMSFNGTGAYISAINLISLGLTASQTLAAWVKPNAQGNPHQTVLATDPGYRYGIKLMTFKNYNRVCLWLGSGSTEIVGGVDMNINDSQWHHVVGVYDYNAGQVYIYIDGVAYTPISTGQRVISVVANGGIGREYHGLSEGYSYSGAIDDVRIYNRALSAADVLELHNNGGPTTIRNAVLRNAVIR